MTPEEFEYLQKLLGDNPSLSKTIAKAILTPLFSSLKSFKETKESARRFAETAGPWVGARSGGQKKYEYESAVTTRLFQLIGLPYTRMHDPLETYGYETGADVEICYDDRRIGIQVTEFSPDRDAASRNSGLRKKTALDAKLGKSTSGWPPLQQNPALESCIHDKIKKASHYDFKEFAQVWLLVATFVPWAPVPTLQLPKVTITVKDLNCSLTEKLQRSKFTRAFIYNMLCKGVYEWSGETGWRCVHEDKGLAVLTSAGTELWFKRHLADPEIHRDPKGWALRAAERVLNDLREGRQESQPSTNASQQGRPDPVDVTRDCPEGGMRPKRFGRQSSRKRRN